MADMCTSTHIRSLAAILERPKDFINGQIKVGQHY
jgi:hypothetical protein